MKEFIVVTGATGRIGRQLADGLLTAEHALRAVG